jgi:hypothetical protein
VRQRDSLSHVEALHIQKTELDQGDLLANLSKRGWRRTHLMLPRNQDFERAIVEFDHVFSRIPLHVCAGPDDGRRHVPSSGGLAVREHLACDAGSKQFQLRAIAEAVAAKDGGDD